MRTVALRWWPVAPLVTVFVALGAYGLDFGHHWDEPWFFLPLKRFARDGHWLPGAYNYPSLSYYLSYLTGLPELVTAWADGKSGEQARRALTPLIDRPEFRMRARAVFLAVTALAVPFVYGSVLATGRRPAIAAIGAAAVVGSFEVAYHARWVAPDGPLLAASAFTTWCLASAAAASADSARAQRALRWAAVGAGLATGTKYPAGLLIISVFVVVAKFALEQRANGDNGWGADALRRGIVLGLIFATVYLLTTPATVFDSAQFLEHIKIQMRTYGGGFGAYTVEAGAAHLARMVLYLTGSLGSRYAGLSWAMSGLAVAGGARLWRRSPWSAAVLLTFPVLFVAYFSIQRTMIVRNLLVVVPPLAVAFAWGVDGLIDLSRRMRLGLSIAVVAVVGLLAANMAFVAWTADTVRDRRDLARFTRAAADYVASQGHDVTFVSPRVLRRIAEQRIELPVRVSSSATSAALLVFETDEGFRSRGEWPAHVWALTKTWFGPWELNFDRYPTWDGDSRIIVMTAGKAREVGLRLLRDESAPGDHQP